MEVTNKATDFRQELYSRYVSRFKGPRNESSDVRWGRWAEYKLLPLLRDVPRDGAVLDVGCGAGQMLQLLISLRRGSALQRARHQHRSA